MKAAPSMPVGMRAETGPTPRASSPRREGLNVGAGALPGLAQGAEGVDLAHRARAPAALVLGAGSQLGLAVGALAAQVAVLEDRRAQNEVVAHQAAATIEWKPGMLTRASSCLAM